MTKQATILGITGGFGKATAEALAARGWKIVALHRNPEHAKEKLGPREWVHSIEWKRGDALVAQDTLGAAEGSTVLVHAVNPPGYKNWREQALPMLKNSIAATNLRELRIVFPGNVYNFSPNEFPNLQPGTPQNPETEKGRIRVEMERLLSEASATGRSKALIVRSGDFLGPDAVGSWFAQGLVKPGKPLESISYPGQDGVIHSWAYLPDLGETVAQLLEKELQDFEVCHFKGYALKGSDEISRAASAAVGMPVRTKGFPWWVIRLASPFSQTFSGLVEMSYLWKRSHELDNQRIIDLLGREPHTNLNEAVYQTLKGLKIPTLTSTRQSI